MSFFVLFMGYASLLKRNLFQCNVIIIVNYGNVFSFAISMIICLFIYYGIYNRQVNSLTRWLPAYGIFVLRFRPKKQQFSVALPTP